MQAGAASDAADVGSFVRRTLAAACRVDPASLSDTTSLLELHADSLTLVSVLSQVEVAFAVDFSAKDTADLLAADDVGELVAAVERRIGPIRCS